MKKLSFILCCCLIFFSGCGYQEDELPTDGQIKIVATLFPQYDFAKNIAKEKANVQLLLPPGTESHTYEPTPSDIINISSSNLFLYTGKYMEPWSDKILSSIDSKDLKVTDVSKNVDLLKESHAHSEEDHDGEVHTHTYDPHIWLDPTLASQMVDNIRDSLCEIDPENKSFYMKNSDEYKKKLLDLDNNIKSVVENSKRKQIVFGGRFAHLYFVKRYGLEYESAFDSCSTEMEPSVKKIAHIVDFIKQNNIPCVYYEELSEPKVATSIANQTGVKTLKFSTAHNLSKEQIEKGTSYLDVMNENLENLKFGLN